MNLSKLRNIKFNKLVNHQNAAVLCNISSSSNNLHKKQRKFYRRPEKPAPLPSAGTASSLAAELFVGLDKSKIESPNVIDEKLDELEVMFNSIDNIPVLIEVDKEKDDESILASDRIPADIPKGTRIFEMFGTPDVTVPMSDVPCPGCGALMHCQDPVIPGYLPRERFTSVTRRRLRELRCQRCVLIEDHRVALSRAIDPDQYSKIVADVSNSNGLAIVVIDLMDMPASIYAALPSLISQECPIYIVGNKVDMMPRDDPDYLRHVHSTLIGHLRELGFYARRYADSPGPSAATTSTTAPGTTSGPTTTTTTSDTIATTTSSVTTVPSAASTTTTSSTSASSTTACSTAPRPLPPRIRNISLVSAKTGYGIETLVTTLLCKWKRKGDVYIMGCTNVGKSTLFNALLSSDYCKSTARDFIGRATTSIWPGTTLNTLRFPILKPSEWQLERREGRLRADQLSMAESEKTRKGDLVKHGRLRDATLMGHIGQTFIGVKEQLDSQRKFKHPEKTTYDFNSTTNKIEEGDSSGRRDAEISQARRIDDQFDLQHYADSLHCVDTPGVVNDQQIINLLSAQELAVLLSNRLVQPRTWTLMPGDTLFVSGLSRIDYTRGQRSIYLTVFAAASLPIVHCKTDDALDFYDKNIGTPTFAIPIGDHARMKTLPEMESCEFSFNGIGWRKSAGDVILSSIGWVAVTADEDLQVALSAFTPAARGLCQRRPSILPYAVNMRGKRSRRNKSYAVRRVYA